MRRWEEAEWGHLQDGIEGKMEKHGFTVVGTGQLIINIYST